VPTEKLYFEDPLLTRFEARVLRVDQLGGNPSLVLDRTLFYPEGGGQLGDQGMLEVDGREVVVTDTQIDPAGDIHHLTDVPIDESMLEASAKGEIDVRRRRDHMAQHTGQHMLSCALIEVAKAETVSSRLGAERSTIDVDVAKLDEALVARAEDLVNDLIFEDRLVRTHFPSADELRAMPLRRPPKVEDGIRIVEVEGLDFSPCGGTHCTRTGQIGLIHVVGLERYKGGTRVTFVAGRRALDDYRAKERVLRELAQTFTCGLLDVPNAVTKLRAELKTRTESFANARGELVLLLGERLLAENPPHESGTTKIVVVREGDELAAIRTLAGGLAKRADVVAIVASREREGGDYLIAIERGKTASFDAGAWLKAKTAAHGGRGGGRPERAEGRLPATADVRAIANEA